MYQTKKDNLVEIELIGSNSMGVFTVHKKIPNLIRKEIGEEKTPFTMFLDHSKAERGQVTLFSRNCFIMKELIVDNDQYEKLALMEAEKLGEC